MSDSVKRRTGSVLKIIPLFLGMIATAVLSLMYLHYVKDMDIREQASQIAREYLLLMESTGYLTVQDEQLLTTELKQLGIDNINLTGTTTQPADYGEKIYLVISGSVAVSDIELNNLFDMRDREKQTPLHISKCTTAKN